MKRIAAVMLAALLIVCGAASLAETVDREAWIGHWTMKTLKLNGREYPASATGLDTIVNIHEDDTVTFSMSERMCVVPLTYGAGKASFDAPMQLVELALGSDGFLVATINMDGSLLEMRLERASVSTLAPEVAALEGEWSMVDASMEGQGLPEGASIDLSMRVYDDGYALMMLNGDSMGVKFLWDGEKLLMTDDSQQTYSVALDAQGQMILEMPGIGLQLVMAREGAQDAGAPFGALYDLMAQVTQKVPSGLTGVWEFTGATVNDYWVDAEDTELDITLTVRDGVDTLKYGDRVLEHEAVVTQDSVTISDIRFVLNDAGQLTYTMEEDGLVMTIYLERQGS